MLIDDTTVLHISSTSKIGTKELTTLDVTLCKKYNIDLGDVTTEGDFNLLPYFISLHEITENVVGYIAGFVVRPMAKII